MKTNKKYAFLMIDYDTPEIIKNLHKNISDTEVYTDGDKYGLEKESHITLVPCLSNDIDINELKKYLNKLSDYKVILSDISKFDCEDYDVLKCAAHSEILNDTNKKIRKDFETFSEHDDYTPHMTIAYMKKGMADKYLKNALPKSIILKPKNFTFSWWDNDEMKQIKFEK